MKRSTLFFPLLFIPILILSLTSCQDTMLGENTTPPPDLVQGDEWIGMDFGTDFQRIPLDDREQFKAMKGKGINKVRIYSMNTNVLDAAEEEGMKVAVTIYLDRLADMASGNVEPEMEVLRRYASIINYCHVGNEVFHPAFNGQYDQVIIPAMQNLLKEVQKEGLDIKIVTPINYDVFENTFPPSSGRFKAELKPIFRQLFTLLNEQGAPFFVNIFPFFTQLYDSNVPIEFCDFNISRDPGNPTAGQFFDPANGLFYADNMSASIDGVYHAMQDLGVDAPLALSETGWPHGPETVRGASIGSAQSFNNGMVTLARGGFGGTPFRPNTKHLTYFFEWADEGNKDLALGVFERTWGLNDENGNPNYTWNLHNQEP
ncbi:glycosyl hydrolase family 17 protein [Xanthovirga aplysinae]|uniref:glycosyl hydrolase family 17 protein n=1 Tax=Xanthovirga aplysinae TaxID=2529853 RepID=UPI0016572F79|nr:glycosyl hydrolase family 17 protein [Xanthovirga aplysinae]